MEQALMRPQTGSLTRWTAQVRLPATLKANHMLVVWLLVATLVVLLACYSVWQLARLGVKRVGKFGAKMADKVQRGQPEVRGTDRMVQTEELLLEVIPEPTFLEVGDGPDSLRRLDPSPTREPESGRLEIGTLAPWSPDRTPPSRREPTRMDSPWLMPSPGGNHIREIWPKNRRGEKGRTLVDRMAELATP